VGPLAVRGHRPIEGDWVGRQGGGRGRPRRRPRHGGSRRRLLLQRRCDWASPSRLVNALPCRGVFGALASLGGGERRARSPSIRGESNDNQLAMRFGGPSLTELCDDDDLNNSKCDKNDEGGHDNKKWRASTRCWKCDGERGKDADITIKLRSGEDGRKL
jgi:hypothetical protein